MSSSKRITTKKRIKPKPRVEDEWEILRQEKLAWEKEKQTILTEINKLDKSLPKSQILLTWYKNACKDNEEYLLEKEKALHARKERERYIKALKKDELNKESSL